MKLIDYNKLIDFTDIDLTPKEAIKFKCHECRCFNSKEVLLCDNTDCALYKYKVKWYKAPRRISNKLFKDKINNIKQIINNNKWNKSITEQRNVD